MDSRYRHIGDFCHACSLLSTVAYAVAVSLQGTEGASSRLFFQFDAAWADTGFCEGSSRQYWTMHDFCFYVNVAICLLALLVIRLFGHHVAAAALNQELAMAQFGLLGHGIGHAYLANLLRTTSIEEVFHSGNVGKSLDLAKLAYIWIFLVLLFRGGLARSPLHYIVFLACLGTAMVQSVPNRLVFAAIQALLMTVIILSKLTMRIPDKDFPYAAGAFIVVLPNSLLPWCEALFCSKFVANLGGHLLYDAYTSVSVLFYYVVCQWYERSCRSCPTLDTSKGIGKTKTL